MILGVLVRCATLQYFYPTKGIRVAYKGMDGVKKSFGSTVLQLVHK